MQANSILLVISILLKCFMETSPYKDTKLNLGGLFPMIGDWNGGEACKIAAFLALDDVNNQTELLPNYKLDLKWSNSECNPGLGTKKLYQLLYNTPRKIIFLSGCSTVTTFIAEAARMWKLVVVSYGSSSPALSNRDRFPTFFRTHPSASIQNPTRIKLLQEYEWKKVALIWQLEEVFTSTVNDFEFMASKKNITIDKRLPFQKNPHSQLKTLANSDSRIIVGLFYESMARRVFCDAYNLNMTSNKVVWILIGWYANDWYKIHDNAVNCTAHEMALAVDGHFTTESIMWREKKENDSEEYKLLKADTFKQRLDDQLRISYPNKSSFGGYPEAPLAYDAIWAIAYALHKAEDSIQRKYNLTLENYTYSNENIYREIYNAMENTSFLGISDTVNFDASGDRISWTKVEQMKNGTYYKVGEYYYKTDKYVRDPAFIPWWRGRNHPPPDAKVEALEKVPLSQSIYTVMCLVSILGIVLSCFCLGFTFRHWQHRCVLYSQPVLNCILTIGCVISLLAVIVGGADRLTEKVESNLWDKMVFTLFCHVKAWLLVIGFSFGYGALFCKIWLVYREATHQKKNSKTNVPTTKSWEAYGVVALLAFVDIILLVVWQIVDPMQESRIQLSSRTDELDPDKEYNRFMNVCQCNYFNIWLGLCFAWKGVQLVFGLLLSYETRNVKLKAVSTDSRFAGMAIYNVVVLCVITAPVSLIIGNQQDSLFAFVAVAVCLSCNLTLGLLFAPKIRAVWRHPQYEGTSTALNDDAMNSKEEEERHERLLAENEQLKVQIAECERRLQELHKKLQTRAQQGTNSVSNKIGVKLLSDDSRDHFSEDNMELTPLCNSGNKEHTGAIVHFGDDQFISDISLTDKESNNMSTLKPQSYSRERSKKSLDESLLLESTSGVFSESIFTTTTRVQSGIVNDEPCSETFL